MEWWVGVQSSFETRNGHGTMMPHEGQVKLVAPHIGLVSTEVHLSLAEQLRDWSLDQVILSGLLGYKYVFTHTAHF